VGHLELETVRVLKEDGVVARRVLGILPGAAVQHGDASRPKKLGEETVDVGAGGHTKGQMIDARPLAVKGQVRCSDAVAMIQMSMAPSLTPSTSGSAVITRYSSVPNTSR
jgi:hypothetical protein